jgi:hypothetical protein
MPSRGFPFVIPLCVAAALLTSGCVSREALSPDFGVAVRADAAAQIADPNARYLGDPPPGSDGARAALAEKRYQADKVIKPTVSSTSGFAGSASTGDSYGGDAGAAPAPSPQ